MDVLYISLGLSLVKKVTTLVSSYFNRTMFNILDYAIEIEQRLHIKDLTLLRFDPSYFKYSYIRVCEILQKLYSKLFVDKD